MKKTAVFISFILFFLLLAKDQVRDSWSANVPVSPGLSIGMNLSTVAYWTRELPFVDVFKFSMPWVTQNATAVPEGKNPWDTGMINAIPADDEGYPLYLPVVISGTQAPQTVATLMCRGNNGHYPAGRYVCLYDGQGKIEFGFDAKIIHSSRGRLDFFVSPSDAGILMKITRSRRSNPIRNIRVIMPGEESTYKNHPFNRLFLERLKPFRVIRFMDWQRTNNSQIMDWANRTTADNYTQAVKSGVAIEYMIDLINSLKADPWFCIPHKASNDYIRNFATLVLQKLDPERRIYIEYSNEVWNSSFDQYKWVQEKGSPHLSYPKKYAILAKNVFKIWQNVFGKQKGRVIRVAGGQLENPKIIEQVMISLGKNGADAIAPAAYFGLSSSDYDALHALGRGVAPSKVLKMARKTLNTKTIPRLKQHASLAKTNGLDLITYEGGQHILPNPPGTSPPFIRSLWQAQQSPLMHQIYSELLEEFGKMNGRLFTAFSFVSKQDSPWGSWGHLGYLDQFILDAPKYQALLDFSDVFGSPLPLPATNRRSR